MSTHQDEQGQHKCSGIIFLWNKTFVVYLKKKKDAELTAEQLHTQRHEKRKQLQALQTYV